MKITKQFILFHPKEYRCQNGKLNIIVGKGERKEEIVCDKAGQNVSIALKEGEFLHMGAIICPGCIEMCGEENCSFSTDRDKSLGREINHDDNVDHDEDDENNKETESDKTKDNRKEDSSSTESSQILNRSSKSFPATDIPDSKIGVKDELDCGGGDDGGFFDEFFDYFD